jgi:hypothetical protein
MSVIRGLKNINAVVDKPKFENTGPKINWLKLADGQSVKIRFVEELDENSASYDESRGLAVVISEHSNPKDYKRKAACTQESDGRCFGCEMARKEPKTGWHSKLRFYCNVVVDNGIDEPFVAVWSQGVAKQSVFNNLREYIEDTGSISNLLWRLKRNGESTETSYTLLPTTVDSEPYDWSKVEPFNLDKVVREIPYAEQEAFFLGFNAPATSLTASNSNW